MAYDEELDARVTAEVAGWGTTRKTMLSGAAHILNGNLLCGIHKIRQILRLGEQAAIQALKKARVMPFDLTGRPMKGWVMVEKQVLAGAKLLPWLIRAYQRIFDRCVDRPEGARLREHSSAQINFWPGA